MAERGSSPTKKQISFINKLRSASTEREEAVQLYLKRLGKGEIAELTVPETSELIDVLKRIKVEGEVAGGGLATGKQISFLTNLQDTEERISHTKDFLENKSKRSINDLEINEASELIDSLMRMPRSERLNSSEMSPTVKQVKFILSLQKSENSKKIASEFMKKVKKERLDELTRKEASELIETLKASS